MAIGYSAVEISKMVNISQQQICEWKKNQNFMDALEEARKDSLRESKRVLSSLSLEAVNTIRDLMLTSKSSQIRLRSAMFILEGINLKDIPDNGTDEKPSHGVNMDLLLKAFKN